MPCFSLMKIVHCFKDDWTLVYSWDLQILYQGIPQKISPPFDNRQSAGSLKRSSLNFNVLHNFTTRVSRKLASNTYPKYIFCGTPWEVPQGLKFWFIFQRTERDSLAISTCRWIFFNALFIFSTHVKLTLYRSYS